MKLISFDKIQIAPERQRKIFDPVLLHELADNIKETQLQNAIVLREKDEQLFLVSGERRLRAIIDIAELGGQIKYDGELIPLGQIPYTLLSDLSPLAAEEAELAENIKREDLSWQERATACAKLARLRESQARSRGDILPSVADISIEVRGSSEGINQETTRRELIVAKHLSRPDVAAAKTVDEAYKILKKQEQHQKARDLGEQVGRTYSSAAHTLLNEDSISWMGLCPDAQFDVILTDPPYGMGADEFGDSGGMAEGAHGYEDSYEVFLRAASALAFDGYRITKEQAHAYIFCDFDRFSQLKWLMVEAGWQVFRTPLIWYKRGGMRAPWPEHGPQRKYETILYAIKGKRPVLRMAPDVIDIPSDANLGHAAQKPVALFADLLRRSCLPGHTVLDPFMGSGPIIPAAHSLKLRTTGIEIDTASYGIALARLKTLDVV